MKAGLLIIKKAPEIIRAITNQILRIEEIWQFKTLHSQTKPLLKIKTLLLIK